MWDGGGEHQGAEQMDIERNQWMVTDDDKHETKTHGAEAIDGHKIDESIALGSWCRFRKRSHAVMPPLVPDSEEETMIRPTSDGWIFIYEVWCCSYLCDLIIFNFIY
jgi:hypothetical protein